ncbi:glycosyltransferase family 32 protein [Massilia sp. CFBP9026]|uniref:glycosyltransferase family 32 protein n=1 Tax=Massilia sp. CFBP9026 TaxID=3096536 RepID=UPI002A6A2943|nr:glycosyltransferase [Massilia sp. CFBP9026]MDY0960587.1 capsular polysaccharide synthesis protein [Massilia sp. CFBP9026]
MNLFSILITDQAHADQALPPAIARNLASLREHHPGLPHRLYGQDAIRDFLRAHMEADVAWAYDQLLPYAYRADLARLCLLHEFGGLYADLSVFFHAPLPLESGKLIVFRDRAVVAPWIVSNTILGAPPRAPALAAAIRMIVANCRSRYRGASSLCPTGPVLLGKAIALHCEPDQIHLGEVSNLAQRNDTESLAFIDATDGRLVGYRTKRAAGLAELGLERGVNDYNDFYYARLTYAADYPVLIDADYLARHGRTSATLEGGRLAYPGAPARSDGALDTVALCHLPIPFAAGRYRVLLELDDATAGAPLTLIALENGSGLPLARAEHRLGGGAAMPALDLDVATSRKDIVIGIFSAGPAPLRIAGLRVERLPQSHSQEAA